MFCGADYRIYPVGSYTLEVSFGDRIDPLIHQRVLSLWKSLKESPVRGQIDLTPSYCTLALSIDRETLDQEGVEALYGPLSDRIRAMTQTTAVDTPIFHVPVCYEADQAPDLLTLSDKLDLPSQTIIDLHHSGVYTVYLLGFLPGFSYLGTLPHRLQLPRKQRPDPVSAGTVAVAADQTGIYPSDSPGGWWRIGRTPLRLFDATDPRIVLFSPGDRIQFYPIEADRYVSIEREIHSISFSVLREKGGWR